ncbi:MAG: hypothetical protein AAFY71_13260 [Bacteroidota bacterium]
MGSKPLRLWALAVLGLVLVIGLISINVTSKLNRSLREPAHTQWQTDSLSPLSLIKGVYPTKDSIATFTPSSFVSPTTTSGGWLCWYWEAEELDKMEILRQMVQIKELGFEGVEICPLPFTGIAELPFADYLEICLLAARKIDLKVSLLTSTGGMALPTGGPDKLYLHQLLFGEAHVLGGKPINLPLPKPNVPVYHYINSWGTENEEKIPVLGGVEESSPFAVFGVKARKEKRTDVFWDLNDQTFLYPDSVFWLNSHVTPEGNIAWEPPAGFWKIIAVYKGRTGQQVMSPASFGIGQPINPFEEESVAAHLGYVIEQLSSLDSFALRQLYGINIGPFAYQADEFYQKELEDSLLFLGSKPPFNWIPALLKSSSNNFLLSQLRIKSSPEFVFSDNDARIRSSYQQYASDAFIRASISQMFRFGEEQNLKVGIEPRGWDFDMIKAASRAHVPTFDQYSTGNSSLLQKIISSGAYLGKRKTVRSRVLGYRNTHDQLSPQEIKIAVDNAFMNGANELLIEGWSGEKGLSRADFLGPTSKVALGTRSEQEKGLWEELNPYIHRMECLLRTGEPQLDMAIYYPFMGFPESFPFDERHQEPFFNGNIPAINDSRNPKPPTHGLLNLFEKETDPRAEWLLAVWPMIKEIENKGLTWMWVNDENMLKAKSAGEGIEIEGIHLQMLLLMDIPALSAPSAENLAKLSQHGARIISFGDLPDKQVYIENFQEKDERLQEALSAIIYKSEQLDPIELQNLIAGSYLPQTVSYDDMYPFLRRISRQLEDSSQINVFRNIELEDHIFQLEVSTRLPYHYWLDPQNGKIHPAPAQGGSNILAVIGGLDTKVLLSSKEAIEDSLLTPLPLVSSNPYEYASLGKISLDKWDLVAKNGQQNMDLFDYRDTLLLDWWKLKGIPSLPEEVHYSSRFELDQLNPTDVYILDLGHLQAVGDIYVNTRSVKTLYHKPYKLDITKYLQEGTNILEIWVKGPPLESYELPRSSSIGPDEGAKIGLLGPVVIHVLQKDQAENQ